YLMYVFSSLPAARAGTAAMLRVSYATTPCAATVVDSDLYSPRMVRTEATTTSLGDLISRASSSVISTSSPGCALRTRSIPHTGQAPVRSDRIVGCMGHV